MIQPFAIANPNSPARALESGGWPSLRPLVTLALACGILLPSFAAPSFGDEGSPPPLPEGVETLPEDRLRTLEPLIAEAVRYRGLEAGEHVPVGIQSKDALGRHLDTQMDEEIPKGMAPLANRVIELFGWIPGEVDLLGEMRTLLGEQVAGYFDPETGYLVIVEGAMDEGGGEQEQSGMSPEEEAVMNDAVMVHEIGHYLQHRHFDLESLMEEPEGEEADEIFFSDQVGARAALVEGDATHLMYSFMMGTALERIPGFVQGIGAMLTDPDAMASFSPSTPGDQALAEAPTFLREEMIFPYMSGLLFVTEVRKFGGQPLVDYAFARDVPTSTEQILHPEKWLGDPESGRRDTPVEIELPELEGLLGERKLVGTWGELDLRIGLRVRLGDDARERAESIAAGWGGDVFALHQNASGDQTLIWITEWDSAADAAEMETAARELWTPDAGWQIAAEGQRVAMIHGEGPDYLLGATMRALLGTRAHRAQEPAIDLATLGISEDELPGVLGPEELMTAMESSPFGQTMGGDLSELEIPENLDVEAMLEDPDFQEMAERESEKAMQKMTEAGPMEVVASDGVYSVPRIGLSITAPEPAWSTFDLADFPSEPKPSLMLVGENNTVVVVLAIPSVLAGPTEALIAGMRMSMPSLEVVEQRNFEGEPEGVELEYTFEQGGTVLRALHHYYHLDGWLLSVQGMAADLVWEEAETPIRALLESIELDGPAAAE